MASTYHFLQPPWGACCPAAALVMPKAPACSSVSCTRTPVITLLSAPSDHPAPTSGDQLSARPISPAAPWGGLYSSAPFYRGGNRISGRFPSVPTAPQQVHHRAETGAQDLSPSCSPKQPPTGSMAQEPLLEGGLELPWLQPPRRLGVGVDLHFMGITSGFNIQPPRPSVPKCSLPEVSHAGAETENLPPWSVGGRGGGDALAGSQASPWAPRTWLYRWPPTLPTHTVRGFNHSYLVRARVFSCQI